MKARALHKPVSALALIAGLLMLPSLADAQMTVPGGMNGGVFNQKLSQPRKEEMPPALPGASQRRGTPAPASKSSGELAPNQALFDAINRGDVAAARDALSRGAQLDAHNVLGMTPMELAVDLGRNDIAFLLLSMRGGASDQPASQASAAGLVAQSAKGQSAKGQSARGRSAKGKPAPSRTARRATLVASRSGQPASIAAPAARPQPKLFAHDGGTAIPSIGFLGFDPQHGTP